MFRRLGEWLRGEEGAIAPILVLLLIPIIGMVAMGTEVSGWYMSQRQLQNAADSAALAAAANNTTTLVSGVASYKKEAYGVAGQYGFQNDGNTSVTPTTVTCPTGGAGCYQVTITRKVPLYLTKVVGYPGNTNLTDGRIGTLVGATAIASGKVAYNYCIVGLGTGGNAGPGNGAQNVSLAGNGADYSQCAARSNGEVKCTAIDFAIIQAPGQQGNTCGSDYANAPANFTDPYANKNVSSLIAATVAAAPACATSLPANITAAITKVCSTTAALTQNTTITSTPGQDPPIILVYDTSFKNGSFTLSTASGSSATIIYTGPSTTGLPTMFTGSGKVTIQGAQGGVYDDFSIINDPKYTSTADFNPGGGSHLTVNVLGTVYLPNTNVVIQGSMESTIGAYSCVAIIAKSLYVNGGSLDNDPLDCKALGYNLAETVVARQALVQ